MDRIYYADSLEQLAYMDADSIDAIVTDPPYGIGFMSRGWDHEVPGPEFWREVLRVAKPGAHLIAMGAPRMYHRLACAIEDSGFVLRDCLQWLYGSGFPKSRDISKAIDREAGAERDIIGPSNRHGGGSSDIFPECGSKPITAPATEAAKEWQGWGTALKPAYEPIALARKPFRGSVADNVLKWGTGALNVDACRIPTETDLGRNNGDRATWGTYGNGPSGYAGVPVEKQGRWPANLVLDETAAGLLDAQAGESRSLIYDGAPGHRAPGFGAIGSDKGSNKPNGPTYGDSGGASRFFYTSKASREEREAGLAGEGRTVSDGRAKAADNAYQRGKTLRKNLHPTVKPLDLMRWLIRLITPPGGVVLDPFCGSGSTIAAAILEGFDAIGIDNDPHNCAIADQRTAWAKVQAGKATARDTARLAIKEPIQLGLLADD